MRSHEPWTRERFTRKNADRRLCAGRPGTQTRQHYNAARRMRRADTDDGAFGSRSAAAWNRLIAGTLGVKRVVRYQDEEDDG